MTVLVNVLDLEICTAVDSTLLVSEYWLDKAICIIDLRILDLIAYINK